MSVNRWEFNWKLVKNYLKEEVTGMDNIKNNATKTWDDKNWGKKVKLRFKAFDLNSCLY